MDNTNQQINQVKKPNTSPDVTAAEIQPQEFKFAAL